uniref:HK97 gp10 family phage protein n=1 Tax=Dulem virus 31 TaxID=3145749 RepID=A0AAU8AUR6_9VIRU
MFDFYAEKLKKYQANVPKIFKRIAKKAAIKAENSAKEITDSDGLVDTGAYKAAWSANSGEIEKDVYAVALSNSMDYASHLEWGHKLRNGGRYRGHFVGRNALGEAHYYAIQQLDKATEQAMIDYNNSFLSD